MSRIGKQPVPVPSGVTAALSDGVLTVEKAGKKLTQWVDPAIEVAVESGVITFTRKGDTKRERSLHGLYRALAANMVKGVTDGYEKRLQIVGVGFGAKVAGRTMELNVGYATPVRLQIPDGVVVETPTAETVVVKGHDKQRVGQFAAEVRAARPPEPYKGKGVRYADEIVKRKAGKTVGAAGG